MDIIDRIDKISELVDASAADHEHLEAENAKLKELCWQCYRFYESIGSDLDGDHIRKAWHGSSTKAEIEQILKE